MCGLHLIKPTPRLQCQYFQVETTHVQFLPDALSLLSAIRGIPLLLCVLIEGSSLLWLFQLISFTHNELHTWQKHPNESLRVDSFSSSQPRLYFIDNFSLKGHKWELGCDGQVLCPSPFLGPFSVDLLLIWVFEFAAHRSIHPGNSDCWVGGCP